MKWIVALLVAVLALGVLPLGASASEDCMKWMGSGAGTTGTIKFNGVIYNITRETPGRVHADDATRAFMKAAANYFVWEPYYTRDNKGKQVPNLEHVVIVVPLQNLIECY